MTTERARRPVHWLVKEIQGFAQTLAERPVPAGQQERAWYEARLAQAHYYLGLAVSVAPEPPSPAPPERPKDLLLAPDAPLGGRVREVWKRGPVAEHRYRELLKADPRNVKRSSATLREFQTGPRTVTFTYPTTTPAPSIPGVSS